eukprot:TRINITY_DN9003_c0_g1_i1.p1 TRINITY_DN9003_c0_g1~~TRINITY_DN9003_c0_g1_i1.p1  ORF type:complete len:420 (-),score=38.81 TRINITY_DN9003_c0_g1_i1:126-1385(-)
MDNRSRVINLFYLAVICIVWLELNLVSAQTNDPSSSPYRVYVATSVLTPLSGFIYNPIIPQNLTFEACVLRTYPFCTDTTSGRRSNNSAMTNIASISSYDVVIQYDIELSSLIYVAADRRTIRRMSPDGADRQIIYNTGQIILGSVAFDTASGTYFYITKWATTVTPRLVDGRQAPIDSDDDLPHAIWMVQPKSNKRPVLLIKDVWTCRSLSYDPKSRILFFSNYTVSTEESSFAVETSLVLFSLDLMQVVKELVVDYTTTFSFPWVCYERSFFDKKRDILFVQGASLPRPVMQEMLWNNILYSSLPSAFDWGAVFMEPQNAIVFREASGGRLVASTYSRFPPDSRTVEFSATTTSIAMFSYTSIRAIGAIPCDAVNTCTAPFSSNAVGITLTAIAFSAVVVLGPFCCAISACYKSKYV